ncbi:hypothetical protein [Mucilaginibacter paludis]|uniref:Uncharacterized protein n=1 Tax=Mucilaginibacter paludis DSM 18603 TaxID=714943 RepID=H1YIC6_9SPHI|nr:hypothetical protein [Mucilaginibacter paludis]EHQ27539.1 hypothetical protein Mucpa_3440 [Mucilaginibacter paludis DSM 18603]
MNENLNMPLRTKILEMALNIEDAMTNILLTYLQIDKEGTKTMGNKSTSLSFRNKIDLLFDLDVLTKAENEQFLLLMEFRNQFLHNIHCASFLYAAEALGIDKRNKLLKFDEADSITDPENTLENAFTNLFINCLDIVLLKYEIRQKFLFDKRKIVTDFAEYSKFIWEKDTELFGTIINTCMPVAGDTKEVLILKMAIHDIVETGTASLNTDETFMKLQKNLNESMNKERVKYFFTK